MNSVIALEELVKQSGERIKFLQQQLAAQHFRYKEKSSPMSYVRTVANDLHYYPAVDVLQGAYMMERFSAPRQLPRAEAWKALRWC